MSKTNIIKLSAAVLVLVAVILLAVLLPKDTIVDCGSCGATGVCGDCNGVGSFPCGDCAAGETCDACECGSCEASGICADCEGSGEVVASSRYYSTFMALIPPIVAISLALITKEVYSSLFAGIVLGALFASNYSFAGTVDAVVNEGIISAVSGTAGIFVFLVILGIIVALLNRAGGAQAFGKWAETHVKTRVGAMLATFALGVLIFIDDYYNFISEYPESKYRKELDGLFGKVEHYAIKPESENKEEK